MGEMSIAVTALVSIKFAVIVKDKKFGRGLWCWKRSPQKVLEFT